jgi:hypothetical protein
LVEVASRDALASAQLRRGVTEMVVHSQVRYFKRELKYRYPNIEARYNIHS